MHFVFQTYPPFSNSAPLMGGDDEYIFAEQRVKELMTEKETPEKDDKDSRQIHVVRIYRSHFCQSEFE